MENPFEEEKQPNKRPAFLTVLCILTFIGAGFSILSELAVLFMPSSFMDGMSLQFAEILGEENDSVFYAGKQTGSLSVSA